MTVQSNQASTTSVDTPEKKRFCSMPRMTPKVLNPGISRDRAELIILHATKWVNGTVLHYYFFDKNVAGRPWKGSPKQMETVRQAFKIWKNLGIGLEFKEVKNPEDAEIRIGFMDGDGSWSYVGREILNIPDSERTMNFGWNIATTDKHNGIDTALHEIGHTLGFPHEHQNPFAGIVWDEEAVYASLAAPPNQWTREETFSNIIEKISQNEVNGSTWDPNSIMHYPFDPGLIIAPKKYSLTGLFPKGGLSKRDTQFVKQFYPPLNKNKFTELIPLQSYELGATGGKQKNFYFKPSQSKYYEIQTFGNLDTVMVLSEEINDKDLQYLTADDNGGTDKNAYIKIKLLRNRKYILKVRVAYKSPGAKAVLMIW